MQASLNLFPEKMIEPVHIPGLLYLPNYITDAEQSNLLLQIETQEWNADLKRRVQHYGYRYDYRARHASSDSYLGPLPDWLRGLSERLAAEKVFASCPDQVIVNEYLPGQGISAHVDCVPCFNDTIASLSLGSACVMRFTHIETGEVKELPLQERSMVVLSGEARYQWQHEIPARKSDLIDGIRQARHKRISLTFRKMVLSE